jgi:hypothetical protein
MVASTSLQRMAERDMAVQINCEREWQAGCRSKTGINHDESATPRHERQRAAICQGSLQICVKLPQRFNEDVADRRVQGGDVHDGAVGVVELA